MSLTIKQIVNSPVTSNCYIVYDMSESDNGCIIVDPGSEDAVEYLDFMKQKGLSLSYIFLTHEHFDHCWSVNELRKIYPGVKLICSKTCSEAIQNRKSNYSVFNQQPGFELKPANIVLEDVNWSLNWDGYKIRFEPAEGHSAAGIIIFIGEYVFTGDTLIKDTKTVTKLKTASKEGLVSSLLMLNKEKGKNLIVCPGHGKMFDLDGYDLNKALF